MKKLLAILTAGALAFSLTACVGTSGTLTLESDAIDDSSIMDEVSSLADDIEEALGGWTAPERFTYTEMSDEDAERFTKAVDGLEGVSYSAIGVLATQIVSGTNYAYLASGETVTATPELGLYIVSVYEDLDGNVSANSIKEFTMADLSRLYSEETEDTDATEMTGAWAVYEDLGGSILIGEALEGFTSVTEAIDGGSFIGVELMGTQAVQGINYAVLAKETLSDQNATEKLVVVFFCKALDGTFSLLEIKDFDVTQYID